MGVPGLWDILRPTGEVRSLMHLAVESGFVTNDRGHRAYRMGIDASIWFFHAQGGREGENPELRTLFFRCSRLMAMPFLPIFVFDGPKRPKIKRGKAVGGKEHWMVNNLRAVLDAFGFECRTAPGEAEAELAYLNRVGLIDAVLSDDVDCFLFGACTVIRNSSATLSGNRTHGARNADGKDDGQHVNIYRADDLAVHPKVNLSKGGLILIALLRGGDYDQHGVDGCGVSTAHALARAGFGDSLLTAALSSTPAALAAFLTTWRVALRHELRTNASGLAPRKCPTLAQRIPEDFPALDVLRCYTHPITSESEGARAKGLDSLWMKRPDVAKIAHVCEQFFEWGIEATIVKRFRSFLWPGAVLRTLLQAALDKDGHKRPQGFGTPSKRGNREPDVETPSKALARTLGGMALSEDDSDLGDDESGLVTTIHGSRRHASTDHILEYRLEIHPAQLVARARSGVQGLRTELADSAAAGFDASDEDDDDDEGGKKKKSGPKTPPPDPDSKLRVWMPAVMVEYAYPRLVEEFEGRQAAKLAKKAKRGTGKAKRGADTESDDEGVKAPAKSKSKATKGKPPQERQEDEENDDVRQVVKSKTSGKSKAAEGKRSKGHLEDESDHALPVVKPKPAKAKARKGKGDAQSLGTKTLDEEDPFLASFIPKQKTKSQPTVQKPEEEDTSPRKVLTPRPFPMTLDSLDSDLFPGFGGPPPPPPTPTPLRRRKHSITSASSSDVDNARTAHLTKSPRKSTDHTSPRKVAPRRSPSPSPARRPLLHAKMKPLQMARSVALASRADDVIVISSDSDVPGPPPKPKARSQVQKTKTVSSAKLHVGVKLALSSSNLNLNHDSDIIDLT